MEGQPSDQNVDGVWVISEPEPEPEPVALTFRQYIQQHSTFTSVLSNPDRKASVHRHHPFAEGGYYPSGYYPSDFVVPPCPLPPVSADALAPYLQEIAPAHAEYRASARHAQAERDEAAALDGGGDGGGWGNDGLAQMRERDAELREVPGYFFAPDFDLAVPATFEKACGAYSVSLQAPHEAMVLQEQLSHYLDIVETRLLRRISQRRGAFFSALVELQRLQLQVQDAYNNVREVRAEIKRLEASVVAPGAGVVSLSKQRQNALATRELLELVAIVRDTQSNIQLLLANEEYAAAMALIRSTQETLDGELKGVHSFRHLGAQLGEYVALIHRLRHGSFETLVLRGAGDGARAAFGGEVELAVDAVSGVDLDEMTHELTMTMQKTVIAGIKSVMRTNVVQALEVCEAHGRAVAYEAGGLEERDSDGGLAAMFDGSDPGWLVIGGDATLKRLGSEGIAAEAKRLTEVEDGELGTGGKLAPRCRVLSTGGFQCVLRHVCSGLYELLWRLQQLAAAVEAKIAAEEAEAAADEAIVELELESEQEGAGVTPSRKRMSYASTPTRAKSLRAKLWSSCLLACAERANYFVVQLVTYRSTAAVHLPRIELARFVGLCRGFATITESLSGGDEGPSTSRPGAGLRTASAQQAKSWLEREQATSLEKVQMMLDSEAWTSSFVTVELPQLLNHFRQCAQTTSPVLKPVTDQSYAIVDPEDEKAVLVAESANDGVAKGAPRQRYRVIQSMLMVLGLLRALLDAADDLGAETMGKEVTQRMVALLRRVNERTRDLVLGTEAMQTADLKSITAKHLAMAAQTLAMLRVVIPLLKAALARRLPAAHRPLLAELDIVADDLQAHHRKLRTKLKNVAESVCKSACERARQELPQLAATGGSSGSDNGGVVALKTTEAASASITNFVKQTHKLHSILVPLLPDSELAPMFTDIMVAHNRFLAETFISMLEASPRSAGLAKQVHADVTLYIKATRKLRPALTGLGSDGQRRNTNERLESFLDTWPAFKQISSS